MVDDAPLTLGSTGQEHLLNDLRQAGRGGFDGTGQRVATQGTEAHHLLVDAGLLLWRQMLKDALVIDHHQRAVELDHLPLGGEVQGHDRDLLKVDVLPDIQFGPVRQREDTDRLALLDLAVVEIPQLGTLILRVPAMLAVAEGVDALLGA